ncbi:MAG TPA: L,D-transpeptidase family protein [Salinimicrobium sp.]|nr:L,D-transpeptidase family protein [Salinimicrobium sp.]
MRRRKILYLFFVVGLLSGIVSCGDSDDRNIKEPAEAEMIEQELSGMSAQLLNAKEVQDFYQSRNYSPIWNHSELRKKFADELKKLKQEGLNYKDYHGEEIMNLIKDESLDAQEQSKAEILFTDAFFELSDHLLNGKINPSKMYHTFGIPKEKINTGEILENISSSEEIEKTLDSLRPQNPHYKGLMASIEEYKKKSTKITDIEDGGKIEPGDEDPRIPDIAQRLKELELLSENVQVEGNIYSEEIVASIKKFQEHQGLALDGIIGQTTIEGLNIDNVKRYKQIMVNLERWRWFPRELGDHYVLVNIPDYRVSVIKNGDTLSTRRAIVGKEGNETPIFSDTIQYIVINPTWTVPTSIRDNEIIPAMATNSNYIASHDMEVLDGSGNVVDPSQVTAENAGNYTFRQRSGARNPLGRVKIIYPNKYAIYLHDTPGRHRFEENTRAISHGCVRVQDAVGLAAYVLSDQPDWSQERIEEVINSGETVQVPVKQKIAVHHFYLTAWNEDGETKFTHDIYELDDEVYQNLIK